MKSLSAQFEVLERRRLMSTTPSQTLADQLVAGVSPANNVYSYNTPVVTWAGLNGAPIDANSSDCSTFVTLLMEQAYGFTSAQFTTWTGYSLPQAEYLYNAAAADHGFTGFTQIANLDVGDMMFMKYLDSSTDTGHCVTVDAPPLLVSTNSTQRAYNLTVVDCTSDPHTSDTRSGTESGVGRGTMRLYTDLTGNLTSYSWGTSSKSVIEYPSTDEAIFAKMPGATGSTWLAAGSSATWNSSTHALVVTGPSTIIADPGSTIAPVVTGSGAASQLLAMSGNPVIHLSSLSLTGGATATVYEPNTGSMLLDMTGGTSALSIDNTSTLDLGANDMKVQVGSLSTVNSLIARGSGSSGTGISSSAARNDTTHLMALGSILNTAGSGALYSSFDGTLSYAADVLVKYTYLGDANLDGKVDGSDYSRLDNGFLSNNTSTGWGSGDFNYDGTINGSDYTLMDNAYNMQGAAVLAMVSSEIAKAIKTPIVTAAAVPVTPVVAPMTFSDELLKKKKVIGLLATPPLDV